MHDVAESLDIHQGNNLHAFRKAYTTQIVTRQIDEHDVFAAFLRIRQQILGELLVISSTVAPRGLEPAIGKVMA